VLPGDTLHRYSPEELETTLKDPAPPLAAVLWASLNSRSRGGCTAYTTVAGELPVVMYVASNVFALFDSLVAKPLMIDLFADTSCATLLTAPMTPHPDTTPAASAAAAAARHAPRKARPRARFG
jgi:hypothetical protein